MQPKGYLWCAFMVKLITFFSTKYFFVQHQLVFCRHKILFCATSTFLKKWFASSCNICLFLSTTDYSLCKITLFCFCHFLFFSCNNKFLFWTFFRKLHHGNIFLLSHSNKNTIRSQKKIFFQVMQKKKKKSWFCVHHKFFTFNFYVAHWQHVDLLRSHPRNKEHLFHLFVFTHLLDLRGQLLRAAPEKRCS